MHVKRSIAEPTAALIGLLLVLGCNSSAEGIGAADGGAADGAQPLGACNTIDFCDDFSAGAGGAWLAAEGTWRVQSGQMVSLATDPGNELLFTGDSMLHNGMAIEADVSGDDTGLLARVSHVNAGNRSYFGYACKLFESRGGEVVLEKIHNGVAASQFFATPIAHGEVHRLRLVSRQVGARALVDCYIDNRLAGSLDEASPEPAGQPGLVGDSPGGAFDNVKVQYLD